MTADTSREPHRLTDLRRVAERGFSVDLRRQGPARPLDGAACRRSAVLMLFAEGEPGGPIDVMLTQRSTTMRHHPGQISFPGGGLEPVDDGPIDAALREAREEIGLDTASVEVIGELDEVWLAASANLVTPVIGWWTTPGPIEADLTETTEAFRVLVDDLVNPDHRVTSVVRRGHHVFRGPAFAVRAAGRDRLIWGFTAALLTALLETAGWAVPWDASREVAIEP